MQIDYIMRVTIHIFIFCGGQAHSVIKKTQIIILQVDGYQKQRGLANASSTNAEPSSLMAG